MWEPVLRAAKPISRQGKRDSSIPTSRAPTGHSSDPSRLTRPGKLPKQRARFPWSKGSPTPDTGAPSPVLSGATGITTRTRGYNSQRRRKKASRSRARRSPVRTALLQWCSAKEQAPAFRLRSLSQPDGKISHRSSWRKVFANKTVDSHSGNSAWK